MKRPGGFDTGPEDLERAARPTPRSDDLSDIFIAPVTPSEPDPDPDLDVVAPAAPIISIDAATREIEPLDEHGDPAGVGAGDPLREAKRRLKSAERSVRIRERREQRRFTAHARRRRRNWLIVGGAVLALAAFVAVGVLSPLTAVREVQVVGAKQVDAAEIQRALARFEGTPLALVQESDVHRALEPFPLIQRYSLERIPPHTLLVRIEERDGVIAIKRGNRYEVLDPAGVTVATVKTAPKRAPVATGAAADPRSPAFAAAAAVVRDLPNDIRKKLVGVTASSAQDVRFTMKDGTRVIWGEATETQRKAVVLRALLKAVKTASVLDVSAPDAPVFR